MEGRRGVIGQVEDQGPDALRFDQFRHDDRVPGDRQVASRAPGPSLNSHTSVCERPSQLRHSNGHISVDSPFKALRRHAPLVHIGNDTRGLESQRYCLTRLFLAVANAHREGGGDRVSEQRVARHRESRGQYHHLIRTQSQCRLLVAISVVQPEVRAPGSAIP